MNLLSVIGLAVTVSFISVLLKQYKSEYSLAVSVIGAIFIFGFVVLKIIPLFSTLRSLLSRVSFSYEYLKILIKALGISYITEIGSEICKESGQLALSSKVELAGKIMILTISLPLMEELLNIAFELINL